MKSYICLSVYLTSVSVTGLYVCPCCYKGWVVFHSICTPSSSFIHTDALLHQMFCSNKFNGIRLTREGCALGAFMGPVHLPQTQLWVCLLSQPALLRVTAAQKQDLLITVSSSPQKPFFDALHDHLATIYPGMRAPSFRCTDAEKGKGLILHSLLREKGCRILSLESSRQ